MSDFPDILGMELYDAAALLEAEGLAFIIVETKPVKRVPADGIFRVIKVQPPASKSGWGSLANPVGQEADGSFVLTVCRI